MHFAIVSMRFRFRTSKSTSPTSTNAASNRLPAKRLAVSFTDSERTRTSSGSTRSWRFCGHERIVGRKAHPHHRRRQHDPCAAAEVIEQTRLLVHGGQERRGGG